MGLAEMNLGEADGDVLELWAHFAC